MSLQQYREVIRSELLLAGFERQTIADSPLENVDFSLSTPCFQAFFKVVDGIDSLERTWRSIQNTIAEYKSANQHVPRDLYLAFLLLEPVEVAQIPFLQAISADALVCRKIVLPTDPDHISLALRSLPFMNMGESATRPAPSLQNILEALGTRDYPETVLDVLSDRASAERILTRLLELPVPSVIPHISPTSIYATSSSVLDSAPCRFEALRVRNFRGIRDAEIDLSANITIIYGQNGTGKTSLFDAIEWVLVGSVERLDSENKDDASGRSPYINLFTREPASVSADISISNVQTKVTRKCERGGVSRLSIDKRENLEDREALELIIGQQATKLDMRILRRLVRTTSFLSQSTLKSFLSDDPKDRYWSLAHLLGTQDYVRLLERVEEVKKIIERRVHEFNSRFEQLAVDVESIRAQIRSREATISNAAGAQELDDKLATLVRESSKKLTGLGSPYAVLFPTGSGVYETESSIAIASDWVDREFRQSRDSKERLLLAEDAANRRSEIHTALQALSKRKVDVQVQFEQANAELLLAAEGKSRADTDLAQLTKKLDRLIETQSRQREALVIAQQMEGLRTLTAEQEKQVSDIESELSGNVASRAQRAQELAHITVMNQRNVTETTQLREEIIALGEAEALATTLHRLRLELPSLEQTIRDAETSIAEQQQVLGDLRTRTTSIQREIAVLSSERERQMGSVEALRGLLADIRKHLVTAECPLCGHEWHSMNELKQAVDERTDWLSPKVKQLDEQLVQMQQRLVSSQTILTQTEETIAQISIRRGDAVSRLSEIESIESQLRERLLRAGLPSDSEMRLISERREAKTADFVRKSEVVAQEEGTLARLRDEQSRSEVEATRREDVRQRMATRLAEARRRLNEQMAQLEAFGFGLAPDIKQMQLQIQQTSREIEIAESSRAAALKNCTDADATLEERKASVASEGRSLTETERGISALNIALKRVDDMLRDAQLDTGVSSEEIRTQIHDAETRIRGLEDARGTLNGLKEISSWLIARREILELNSKLDSLGVSDETINTERATLLRWNNHLDAFYKALVDIKAEVENLQLENYGPIINLLYQRLNTHPIFTELRVSVDALNQSVAIHLPMPASISGIDDRKGLALPHYLSEAQLNVAALSIFLSPSFQQRWSSFEPLFLDDPVQNMDDFNANGFIDCLRSLAGFDRQFIVSTCDIGFYRLLLLKLRCMNHNGQVRFRAYRLEGISEEGPRIVQDFPATNPVNSNQIEVAPSRVN